jgi:hypothetical protein
MTLVYNNIRIYHQPQVAQMNAFYDIMLGYFFGFALGVGCALAVMYTIYTNGYKKGIEHSLLREKPKRYYSALAAVEKRFKKAAAGNANA